MDLYQNTQVVCKLIHPHHHSPHGTCALFHPILWVRMQLHILLEVPVKAQILGTCLDQSIDPYAPHHSRYPSVFLMNHHIHSINSILTCRFILSLRQLESAIAESATHSGAGSQVREHVASTVLEFSVQPSDSLLAFIASFTYPIHIDYDPLEAHLEAIVNNGTKGQGMDMFPPGQESQSLHCSPIVTAASGQPTELIYSV